MAPTGRTAMTRIAFKTAAFVAAASAFALMVLRRRRRRRQRAADAGARRLFLRQREDGDRGRQDLCHRPDVCRRARAGAPHACLSDRDGAWRHHVGREFHRHARRARGLGAIFRAARLCGLCGRSAGARALGLSARDLWPARNVESSNSFPRFVSQEKSKLWPQAVLHTQWPGTGNTDDPAAQQ